MIQLSEDLRARLLSGNCCVEIDPATAESLLSFQQRSFLAMQRQARHSGGANLYLLVYDSLMRVVESWLIKNQLLFGDSPHKGLRMIVREVLEIEQASTIEQLVEIRHSVKKRNGMVTSEQTDSLEILLKRCSELLGEP